MKIAITGANGYIGCYVMQALVDDGRFEPVPLARNRHSAPYLTTDYSPASLRKAFAGVDAVAHLAALKNVRRYSDMEENISLTCRVADAARAVSVRKIVYASSISVYSDETMLPWKEESAASPSTLYGISKLMGEYLLRIKAESSVCLRLAHVIGPCMQGNYMIPVFLKNAMNGEPLIVRGKSAAKRELIDVRDVTRAVLWALTDERSDGQTVNIGTGIGLTNLEIAETIGAESGAEIRYDDSEPEAIKSSVMRVEKAGSLGFSAQWTPQEALRTIIQEQLRCVSS